MAILLIIGLCSIIFFLVIPQGYIRAIGEQGWLLYRFAIMAMTVWYIHARWKRSLSNNTRTQWLQEIKYSYDIDIEDSPVLSPTMNERYAENVLEELDNGNVWAWCQITVRARWESFEGIDSIGCCSYRSETEFINTVYPEMCKLALDDLEGKIRKTKQEIDRYPLTT